MELIPHQGISIVSILRGIIGLSSIILIAYLLSNNKRNIDWKTIIIGISSQFVIAIAVLKVDFVRIIFEKIGQGFLAIVTYTCLLYTSPSPRDRQKSRMPSSA